MNIDITKYTNYDNFNYEEFINNYPIAIRYRLNTKKSAWNYIENIKKVTIIKNNRINNIQNNRINNIQNNRINNNPPNIDIQNHNNIQKNNNIQRYSNNINYIEYNPHNYYDKLPEFNNLLSLPQSKVIVEQKLAFRYFCYKYLDLIRLFKIPELFINLKLEAVLIEFRILPHLEFLIRNMILKLGNTWSYSVICGNLNYDYIINTCNTISKNIKIIKLDYDNLNQSTYSKLLSTATFWNYLEGEKILVYQEDSCIFKSNIEDFLHWDYIGAPWPWLKVVKNAPVLVGNGGFSLRSKECMLQIINTVSMENTDFTNYTINSMLDYDPIIGPEDVYFTLNMKKYDIGLLADWDAAYNFSSEYTNNFNSFGGHNFWLGDKKWQNNLLFRIFRTCVITIPIKIYCNENEIKLLEFVKNFSLENNCLILIFTKDNIIAIKNMLEKLLGKENSLLFIIYNNTLSKYIKSCTYTFDINNYKDKYNV